MNAARSECRFGVSRGTQLNLLRADFVRGLDLLRIRIDKQARENVCLSQLRSTAARTIAMFAFTSRPPSVVISLGFSATSVTASGLASSAISEHLFSRSHLEIQISRD